MKKVLKQKIVMKKFLVKTKYIFWERNFENVIFEGAILKMSLSRKRFILKRLDDSDKE